MSDLDQLKKNLVYKMKAQDIGLASWKGSHGKPQKMFIPTKDYLLNSASKLQDEIQKRNEMMEEYIEEQRTPIIRYDEYGDPIVDADGKPVEYRFHAIDPPDLNLTPLRINFYDPKDDRVIDANIDKNQQLHILKNKDNILNDTNEYINNKIQDATYDINIFNKQLDNIDIAINEITANLKIVYDTPKLENRKKLRKEMMGTIKSLKKDKEELIDTITVVKDNITNLTLSKETFKTDIEDITSKIKNELKNNEQKVKAYQEELSSLNSGQLNTYKNFDETDEEYLERLQRMGDMPFADRNTQEKAYIRLKDKLRDNLKLIIRNNAVINQVTNFIYKDEPDLLNDIIKYFPGFQEYFIKKFGENNEKINFKDIVNEILLYIKKATDPDVLSGRVPLPENQLVEYMGRNLAPTAASSARSSRRPSYASESDLILPSQQESYASLYQPSARDSVDSLVEELDRDYADAMAGLASASTSASTSASAQNAGDGIQKELLDNYTILRLCKLNPEPSKDKNIYIRMVEYVEPYETYTTEGDEIKIPGRDRPMFFYSKTGDRGSFIQVKGTAIYKIISKELDVSLDKIKQFLKVQKATNITINDITAKFKLLGLRFTRKKPYEVGVINEVKNINLLGLGVKQSDDLPEKVQFGKNILFLKKLFLKNILSIQNKHNVKINGFNNVHVSDNFVKIIMNLINNINFNNNDLQNLSSNERLLLDNLLMLSELNKQFVTGSSTDSLNKLKKDYEILIGEIESGNNNDLLKKKLYHILMKLTHFGAIGFPYAIKHYKEIIKEYF